MAENSDPLTELPKKRTRSPERTPTKSPKETLIRSPREILTRSPRKTPTRSPREPPTRSPREPPTRSPNEPHSTVLERLVLSPKKSIEHETVLVNVQNQKKKLCGINLTTLIRRLINRTESELELKNDNNLRKYYLQNYDLKYWPLLSFLDADFFLQIEMVMLYGWENNAERSDAALIVTKDKNVYGLGNNKNNQLGITDESIICTILPQKVKALCQKNIKKMMCSNEPCLFVLTEEGEIYSWGDNKDGKLGYDIKCGNVDTFVSYHPIKVDELADKHIVDIKCGYCHTLALDHDGKVYSWGRPYGDQMIRTPIEVIIANEYGIKQWIKSISCGSVFNMALTFEGILYGWGGNQYGQLGLGSNDVKMYVEPMKIEINLAIAKVECGFSHTLALTREGLLYVWGQNDHGQLGIACQQDVHSPRLIDKMTMGKVLDIATQYNIKTSAAVIEGNRICVWGSCAYHNILNPVAVNFNNIQDAFVTNRNVFHFPCLAESSKQSNVAKCLGTAFNDSTSADVVFIVEEQSLHIHRTIIRIRCPKMYELIFANNSDTVITRNDFSAVLYKAFFKYLYTDIIDLPHEKILELHNLAIFYHDEILAKDCNQMIKERINKTNVIHFYDKAILLEIKELEEFCFKYAISNMTAVVKTNGFAKLSENKRFNFIINAADAGAFKN